MRDAKPVSILLAIHFRLSIEMTPIIDAKKRYIKHVLYASVIITFMYVMVCTRLDLARRVNVVIRYMKSRKLTIG